jgi:hypothetical protein
VCGRVVGCVGVVCVGVGWDGGWCGVWGVGVGGCVCGRVMECVGVVCLGGRSPLALEHSKVCTMCDFGHLQFNLIRQACAHSNC